MIVDTLVGWVASFIAWFGSLISLPMPPAFMAEASGYAGTVAGYVGSTGVWLPWPLIGLVLSAYVTCLAAGLAVKLVRIVASFVTAGGGSAA